MPSASYSPRISYQLKSIAMQPPSHIKETILYTAFALSGWYVPNMVIWPLVGGVKIRPIPYQVIEAGDVLLDLTLSNEAIENVTIPGSLLTFTCIWVPLIIMSLVIMLTQPPKQTKTFFSLDGIHCFLFAIGIEEFTSQSLKMYVGRLRPNFYSLCGFDSKSLQCTADMAHQYEARLSFPSGHSSLSFCGMGVLMWFCLGCWIRFCSNRTGISNANEGNERGGLLTSTLAQALRYKHGFKGVLFCMTPLLYCTFVATSRIVDNWHHPSDILAGIIIGFSCATISYHLWFYSLFSDHAGLPLRSVVIKIEKAEDEEENPLVVQKV